MKKIIFTLLLLGIYTISPAQVPFQVGQQAPDFTVTDYNGNTHNLYTYCSQGKYVLIDFFSYWCQTCLETSHHIDDFYHQYGCNLDNVIVLGNESDPAGTLSLLYQFINHSGGVLSDTYPHWAGSQGGSTLADLYVIMAYPTLMLIGPDSTFLKVKIWPITSVSAIESAFPPGVLTPDICSNDVNETEIQHKTSIFPNPAHNRLQINLYLRKTGTLSIRYLNMLGCEVLQNSRKVNPGQVQIIEDIRELKSGIYIVRGLLNDETLFSSKIHILKP
jgi:peroxiredoxin